MKKRKAGKTADVLKLYRIKAYFYKPISHESRVWSRKYITLTDPRELPVVLPVCFYFNIQLLSNKIKRSGIGLLGQNSYLTEKS